MMKANELQETKTLVDIDDTYPEEIVVEGEGGFEYGLSREEERGLIGFIRNLTRPTRREVIEPEKTVFRQKVDAPAGEYTKEYTPAKYGEEEVSLDYAPAVRGTRAAFEYAKSLFGSQETRDEAIAALKQAPAVVEKSMKDQMTAALGMTQGAESVVTREGEEITFDPLAVPATMVPGGIAARAAATEGSTVLGIFGGKKGKSFAEREAAFEKAVNDGLKDEADLPDAWKGDEYLSKMFLDQDVFEKSGGAFRAEDGILKYEIPTRNVKLKTIKEGGVFDDIGGVKIAGSPIDDDTVVFSNLLFAELQNKKIKEVLDNPEKFAGIQTQAGYTYSTQDVIDRTRTTSDMSENAKRVFRENVTDFINPVVIQDVLDFPELFDEYPALAKIKFRVEDLPPGSGAYYNPLDESGGQAIVVDSQTIAKKEVLKSILHELQHAVDHMEDRQFGASVQAYLPRNASAELDKIAMSARIATQTLEGSFPPEKFGNLYPDANNYKALRGLSHKDARTIDLVRKLNSPELIEDMRARNPNPESHAGRLIEAYDSMDDMQRILFKLYDEKMGDKYKRLTEIYEEAQRKYLSTPGEVDARNVEDRFDNPDQQIGGDSPVLPTIFKDTDDAGRTIHKDMSLTGGEDVDDVVFKQRSTNEPDTVKAVGMSDKDIDTWRKENATSEDFRKRLKGRSETLQNLAAGVKAGDVTRAEYREAANAFRPIREVSQVPEPATPIEMVSALNKGQRQKGIVGVNKTIPDGDRITARLDINAYTDYDVWIPTLTHPELKTVYSSTVVMKNVRFIQPEDRAVKQAMDVATGKPKAPFAVMEGDYMDMSAEDAYSLARESFDSNEWTQVGYDPTKRGFFYNRSTGEPVLNADEVIQVGHLVLAKNAKMGKAEDFAFKRGGLMARK